MSSIPPPPRTRGRQVTPGVNDLATTHAEIAAQWHKTLNGDLWPQHVSAGSARKVWWECSHGHAWEAGIGYRVRHGFGCPYCSGRMTLPGFNDLATRNPGLAAQWHKTLNGDLTPRMMTDKSHRKVWWECPQDHAWQAQIKSRASGGHGCPYCSGRNVIEGVNDLATLFADLAVQWHPTKNGALTPNMVKPKASKKVWWLCGLGHEWQARIADRTGGHGCPACSGKSVVPGFNDLATTNRPLAAQWHRTKNGGLAPQHVTERSNKMAWWECVSGHDWEATICSRSQGNGCPFCANKAVLPGFNDLATTDEDIAAQWHRTKNGDLLPTQVTRYSSQSAWWECAEGHEWVAVVGSRTNGRGCPFCANKAVLPGFNDLATTDEDIAAQWHRTKNGDLLPTQVTRHSGKPAWWECAEGHEWRVAISKRTSGRGCPICANRSVVAGVNDLGTTHAEIATQWHPTRNGDLTPSDVTIGTDIRIWWRCLVNPEHPDWCVPGYARKAGKGCARCAREASRGEEEIAEVVAALLEGTGQTVIRNDRKVLGGREIDVLVPSRLAIEFNGVYWHSEPYRTTHDHANKAKAARAAGLQFVAVWEDEWNARRDIVVRALAHRLGVTDRLPAILPDAPAYWFERIGARALALRTLTKAQADEFLEAHHVQGTTAMLTTYGLVDDQDRIRAALSIRVRGGKAEIARYATAGTVPGGFTRLVAYAEPLLPETVTQWVTFADHAISDGGLYEATGFIAEKVLRPDYSYASNRTGWQREHKFNYRLKRFREDPNLLYVDGATERELAAMNGLVRVWDYGKTRYVKDIRR